MANIILTQEIRSLHNKYHIVFDQRSSCLRLTENAQSHHDCVQSIYTGSLSDATPTTTLACQSRKDGTFSGPSSLYALFLFLSVHDIRLVPVLPDASDDPAGFVTLFAHTGDDQPPGRSRMNAAQIKMWWQKYHSELTGIGTRL